MSHLHVHKKCIRPICPAGWHRQIYDQYVKQAVKETCILGYNIIVVALLGMYYMLHGISIIDTVYCVFARGCVRESYMRESTCVRMCVRARVCVYVCVYTRVRVCLCMHSCAPECVRMFCMCARARECMCVLFGHMTQLYLLFH
jgi:hypothetical protein